MAHSSSSSANLARTTLSQRIGTTSRILDSTLESADFVENITLQSARRAASLALLSKRLVSPSMRS